MRDHHCDFPSNALAVRCSRIPAAGVGVRLALLLLAACAAGDSIRADEPAAARRNADSPLGINLSGVVDWSSEMPFVDVFKHSRAWISQADGKPWGQGPALAVDDDGWVSSLKPGQYATTLMCVAGGHPAGRYVCLFDGEGELEFAGNARAVQVDPGRIELDVTSRDTLMLHLRRTDPTNPVRNIRVLMPGFESTYERQVFYPPFLDRYRPFAVLRFMDWMSTNNSRIARWRDRPQPRHASQAVKGVALEHMLELANWLEIDPWFCMPHLAGDDYIREFATQVKNDLDRGRRVYIEHSNEVWNGQFEQARHAADRGKELNLSSNAYQAQLHYHSRRSVEIFRIWEEVFGGSARLVRVLGSHSANPWASEQITTFEDAHRHADAVAIAPYFGYGLGSPETAAEVASLPMDQIVERCRRDIAANRDKTAALVAQARRLKLDVIAYEGGQHLVGHGGAENDDKLTETLQRANRDRQMKALYLEDLTAWKQAGGRLFVVFSSVSRPSKWGSWGVLEYEGQPAAEAPKYEALLEFLRENQRWWKEGR